MPDDRTLRDRERLLGIFSVTSDAFFEVDLATRAIDWHGPIDLIIGGYAKDVGRDLDEWRILVHPADIDRLPPAEALAPGATLCEEFRLRRADGTYASVRVRAIRIPRSEGAVVIGALSDLGPLRELEAELREANERMQIQLARERQERVRAELTLRVATKDALFEWQLDHDRIGWSPNVKDVLGYSPEEIAAPASVARHSPELAGDLDGLRGAIATGRSAWSRRLTWRLPSEKVIHLEEHAYVLRRPDGHPERVIGSFVRADLEPEAVAPGELTARQRQVLWLVRLGHTNKQIGAALGISEQGAKAQIITLMRKFRVPNRAALAVAGRPYAVP